MPLGSFRSPVYGTSAAPCISQPESLAAAFIMLDLPQPLRPARAIISPVLSSKDRLANIRRSP